MIKGEDVVLIIGITSSLFMVESEMYFKLTFNLPINQRVLVEKKEPDANDLRWYNLYSDGWCEQGFCPESASAASISTIDLLKAYKDTNYDVLLSGYSGDWYPRFNSKTMTTVTFKQAMRTSWYTCGYTSTNIGKTIIKY